MKRFLGLASAMVLVACSNATEVTAQSKAVDTAPTAVLASGETATAVFAGGCFWCTEKDFEAVPGVIQAVSGYTGGTTANPTYKQVGTNTTGHYEAVEVTYDPAQVSYEELVNYYWRTVDPTDATGQFCDKGESYRTAVFVTAEQRAVAEASLAEVEAQKPFGDPIVTPILEAQTFYDAEDYHQDYYKKNPVRYKLYRTGCGRDARLKRLWGDAAGVFEAAG